MKRTLLFLLCAAGTFAAESIDPKRAANTVNLDETGAANLRIELTDVEETDFEETVFALGHIEVLPDKRAVVSTRILGRAETVIGREDMKCEAGDELLWVEARQPGDKPVVRRVDAPIAGIIAKVNVAQGQPVGPDDSLMEIYDLSTVEAIAAVPEHLAGRLAKDQDARIRVPGFPEKTWDARVAHLGVTADAGSGTMEVAFHVPNEDGLLRPGMRAEFSIVVSKREGVMSVPRSALLGEPSNRYVYVKDSDERMKYTYIKSPVVVGQMNDQSVEIVSGLLPADSVVTRGAYSLSFAGGGTISLKEALDAAHGHKHNEDGSEMTPEQAAAEAKKTAGGHDHGDGEGSGDSLMWKVISAILFVLLIITGIRGRGYKETAAPPAAPPAPKPEVS
ncbi:MAG TPA: efflux RND transporter periplasmic adaptor subunit [Verrucomicrobiales bacterium]|nr:efflux RND transporter periplasmic adaptor subunit [Verrucomicrobiales bacterium]